MTSTTVEVAALALLAAAALAAMWLGWQRRAGRWAALAAELDGPAFATAPGAAATYLAGPMEATYVATTPVDSALERVPVRHLGVRATAEVAVGGSGLLLRRPGEADLLLPADRLIDAAVADGIAGTAVARGRLVVVRWTAADRTLQTGVLPRHDDDRVALTDAVNRVAQTRKDAG